MEKTTWNAKVSFPGFGTTAGTAAEGNDSRLSDARAPLAHTQAWSTITSTPTTLAGYGITNAQPLDADLTAIAGLTAAGFVARTGAGTSSVRTITGTANQVTVTNGDGVSGNPTLSLPQSISTTSTPTFAGLSIPSGSVGVGTSSPQAHLHVGSAETDLATYGGELKIFTGANTSLESVGGIELPVATNGYGVKIQALSAEGSVLAFANRNGVATWTERMRIGVSGGIRFNAYGAGTLVTDSSGNITPSSDASLKTVTGTFTRGLADVLKLTPRTYHWNEKSGMDTEDENVGFIAQEVLDAVPEAVGQYRTTDVETEDWDGKKTKKREKAELLTLSDRPLIAALVNAVKELKAENDDLRKRLDRLETKKGNTDPTHEESSTS